MSAHIDIRAANKCNDLMEECKNSLEEAVAVFLIAIRTQFIFGNKTVHIAGKTDADIVQIDRCGFVLHLAVICNEQRFSAA